MEVPEPPAEDEQLSQGERVAQRLSLLGGKELDRGNLLVIDSPVGRYEVMLPSRDAQLQLGTLECPLSEAVARFAPAATFDRTEPGKGRMVVALPLVQF